MHYGMAVDLKLCIGCNSCAAVCKLRNGTPPGIFWGKVIEEEVGVFPKARRVFWSVRCMHCEQPACLTACPTDATYKRADGLVLMDGKKCIGCKACIMACPYNVRYLWDGNRSYFSRGLTPYEEKAYARHVPGTVQKCDFCASRLDEGLQPSCVETCLCGALIFGDLDDLDSEVRQVLSSRVHFRLKEELGTQPSIYYLA